MESLISSASSRVKGIISLLRQRSVMISTLEGQRSMVEGTQKRLGTDIGQLNQRISDLKILETYLAQFADERQLKVYQQIEMTVTEGLQSVFGEDIQLEISNKMVGARSETVFSLVSQTEEGELRTSIMDSRGGGVAAIVGFLIQAVLVLLTPELRPIIFLDEAFRAVSSDYQVPLGEFISDLCERTGLQVVLVTHNAEIVQTADVVYAFEQTDGKTKITRMV